MLHIEAECEYQLLAPCQDSEFGVGVSVLVLKRGVDEYKLQAIAVTIDDQVSSSFIELFTNTKFFHFTSFSPSILNKPFVNYLLLINIPHYSVNMYLGYHLKYFPSFCTSSVH